MFISSLLFGAENPNSNFASCDTKYAGDDGGGWWFDDGSCWSAKSRWTSNKVCVVDGEDTWVFTDCLEDDKNAWVLGDDSVMGDSWGVLSGDRVMGDTWILVG